MHDASGKRRPLQAWSKSTGRSQYDGQVVHAPVRLTQGGLANVTYVLKAPPGVSTPERALDDFLVAHGQEVSATIMRDLVHSLRIAAASSQLTAAMRNEWTRSLMMVADTS